MRIGQVGCGRWGAFILRDLRTLGCAVIVAAKGEESRRRAEAGGAAFVDGIDRLPRDLDGYVVAVPTSAHGELTERLLDFERPIFVEKPLTDDVASAHRIAERGAGRVFVMEKWRYHPGIEALGAIARSGEIGDPRKLVTARLQWGYNHSDVDAIWTLLPHDLSIIREIVGRIPPPIAAFAERDPDGTPTGLFGRLDDDGIDIQVEVSIRRPRFYRAIELICRDGIAVLGDSFDDAIRIHRNDGDPSTHIPEPELRSIDTELPLLRELAAFVGFCRGGPPPKSTAADGAAVVETIVALRRLAGIVP